MYDVLVSGVVTLALARKSSCHFQLPARQYNLRTKTSVLLHNCVLHLHICTARTSGWFYWVLSAHAMQGACGLTPVGHPVHRGANIGVVNCPAIPVHYNTHIIGMLSLLNANMYCVCQII